MAEYVEREKVVLNVLGLTIVDPAVAAYADAVLFQINEIPAANVVPVVRCKDCVHGINSNGGIACTEFCNVIHKLYDFCSRGERKEDYE